MRYPPLRASEFVNGSPDRLIRIVLGGLAGDIVVQNKHFAEVMPPWHVTLDDEQVAQVLTFVRQAWGNISPGVRPQSVARLRPETQARGGIPWSAADLEKAEHAAHTE